MKNQEVYLPNNIKKINQLEVDQEFYMDFIKYIKPLLTFVRLILFVIGTPSYKLATFLVPKLSSITFNEFTVKVSFSFAEEIVHLDSKLFMGSLDVDSLFTNTPLVETINICTSLLFNNENVIEGISKSGFKNLLSLATQESYFIFNNVP